MADKKVAAIDDEGETAIKQFKIKKIIKNLEAMRGNGTSVISLIVPPRDQISRVNKMLADEYGTASNIKSRVNRLSVLSAITSVQARLKLYTRVPNNGLIMYCGSVMTAEGKEKKISVDFEPFKPINTSLYLCDNKFHTEALNELLESDDKFGFIIVDGQGALYGTLAGNTREVLHKFQVELPKKHGRGGQSALRFARLRLEKRHNYLRKVADTAVQFFIAGDKPIVQGLVLAGSAEFKLKLLQSDMFDPRLANIVLKTVDVSYGGENGFNQAIELSGDALRDVKFVREKKLLTSFMGEIAKDSGRSVFGVKETIAALELGAVEELIVFEDLDVDRYVLKNKETGEERFVYLSSEQAKNSAFFKDPAGNDLEVFDKTSLVDWLSENYVQFGAKLAYVSNKSQEGSLFCRGFGGIGGLLRYKLDVTELDQPACDDHNDVFGDDSDAVFSDDDLFI